MLVRIENLPGVPGAGGYPGRGGPGGKGGFFLCFLVFFGRSRKIEFPKNKEEAGSGVLVDKQDRPCKIRTEISNTTNQVPLGKMGRMGKWDFRGEKDILE